LECPADPRPQGIQVLLVGEDVLAVEHDLAGRALAGVERIHAVEGAQQSRFSAAGGTDESGDPALRDLQLDVFQRVKLAVEEIEILSRKLDLRFADVLVANPGLDHHRHDQDAFCRNAMRAAMLSASTASVMSSAPAQASLCQL